MEIALILFGLLIMSVAGLWFLGAAFSESLMWGLTLLGLSVASAIFSVGVVGGAYTTELTVIFQVFYWIVWLSFLYQYWEVVKKPFFLSIFGGLVFGAGFFLGGMSFLSSQGSGLLANLSRSESAGPSQGSSPSYDRGLAVGDDQGMRGFNKQEIEMFDSIAERYSEEKEKGMSLDPRYDQAIRDYQAMRGQGSGQGAGSSRGGLHGGPSGNNPEPEPLIGKRSSTTPAGDSKFNVSSSDLFAASQKAKQARAPSTDVESSNPWYRQYRQATRPAISAWQRVHRAVNDPQHGRDLAPACKELFQATSRLHQDLFKGAPDDRISHNLTQGYSSLRQAGSDCMAGKMTAATTKLGRAAEEMGRAKSAMAPFGMKP